MYHNDPRVQIGLVVSGVVALGALVGANYSGPDLRSPLAAVAGVGFTIFSVLMLLDLRAGRASLAQTLRWVFLSVAVAVVGLVAWSVSRGGY
ncbi:MAG: hypothetical protein R6W93_03795 [Candidatus Limnocylindrales bacterium]